MLAVGRGDDIKNARWRAGRSLAVAKSQHLAHLVGVNNSFTGLIRESRSQPGCRLVEWRSERSWIAQFDDVTSTCPDGLGVWEEDGARIEFFLKYDRSTEPDAVVPGAGAFRHRGAGGLRRLLWTLSWPTSEPPLSTTRRKLKPSISVVASMRSSVHRDGPRTRRHTQRPVSSTLSPFERCRWSEVESVEQGSAWTCRRGTPDRTQRIRPSSPGTTPTWIFNQTEQIWRATSAMDHNKGAVGPRKCNIINS